MSQQTLEGDTIDDLREEYRHKVTEMLPERAQSEDGWPIHLDHCFGRVVLDNLFGDEWYDHVDGRPAYMCLSMAELQEAIDIADSMLEDGPQRCEELNDRSLRWRA